MTRLFLMLSITIQFVNLDRDFRYNENYQANFDTLKVLLRQAETPDEKSEVLWRLSRVCLMLGEGSPEKEIKRDLFNKGINYAEEGIRYAPENINCIMWHCANVGRECQTHSLMDQAAAVPVMMKDLTCILDELGETEFSEAWQALSEIYYNHPFKSKESAINYARKAATCIPSDELRLSTYIYLATQLYERGWSAKKRKSASSSNSVRYNKENKSNIDKYAYFDGDGRTLPWTGKPASESSDKEEASAIIEYAISLYEKGGDLTHTDHKDYKELLKIKEQYGKETI